MASCAYHPDKTAIDRCAECARDICSECRTEVAGKPVCSSCVQTIRSRVAAEMAATPSAPAADPYSAPQPGFVNPAPASSSGWAPQTSGQMPSPIVQEPPSPARLLVGIALGALLGAIGAFIWKTISFYAHVEIAYINILVGCAAGFGVAVGSGRQGILPAILGGILGFCSMMFGYYLLMSAEINKALPGVSLPFDLFLEGLKDLSVIDWLFVAAGVYGGFIIPMRSNTSSEAAT